MKLGWKIALALLIVIIILIFLNKYSNEGFLSSNKTGYVMSGDDIVGTIPVENIITITTAPPPHAPDQPPMVFKAYLAQNDTNIINNLEITDPVNGKERTEYMTVKGDMLGTIIKYDPVGMNLRNKYTVIKKGSPTMLKRPSRNPTGYTLSGGDLKSPIAVLRIIDTSSEKIFLAQDKSKIIVHVNDITGKPLVQGHTTGNMIGNINTVDLRGHKIIQPPTTYTLEKI
jgi:hypothetical protein